MIEIKTLNTILALVTATGIFVVIQIIKANLEAQKINKYCSQLQEIMLFLKKRILKNELDCNFLNDCDDKIVNNINQLIKAYNNHIRENHYYKKLIVDLVSNRSGKNFSMYDLFEFFEKGKINDFFLSLVMNGGYLFANIVYLSLLKKYGFATRYQELKKQFNI
ncbi:hypothetical protein FHQ18_10290 [Deferribacter autotrophicus]|uniref:DUF4760 domain-containing protein n=1 Tax=Deferribacter autotrophicus TaxID=500465 RepID=A0A5A8F1X2_9BACT|nr:hypothetical protein [Deferribacter autotrophicus]KAA0257427.1 hypothetical protein FHQ18_10290 [Deferribacter autotrophicus]